MEVSTVMDRITAHTRSVGREGISRTRPTAALYALRVDSLEAASVISGRTVDMGGMQAGGQ
jgi:hypothetical protein